MREWNILKIPMVIADIHPAPHLKVLIIWDSPTAMYKAGGSMSESQGATNDRTHQKLY